MTGALLDLRVHRVAMLGDGFSLTVEWDPDSGLDWDAHWQVWLTGPGVRHRLQAYPAYTDACRCLTKIQPLFEKVRRCDEHRALDI